MNTSKQKPQYVSQAEEMFGKCIRRKNSNKCYRIGRLTADERVYLEALTKGARSGCKWAGHLFTDFEEIEEEQVRTPLPNVTGSQPNPAEKRLAEIRETAAERDRLRSLNAELVAALKELELFVRTIGLDSKPARQAAEAARAAIAKAKGE